MTAKIFPWGFTLLEVLVAFVLAALALGVLYGGALGGLRAQGTAGREARALAVARSRLALLDPQGAVSPGVREGEERGGYRWTLTAVPLARAPGVDARTPLVLYDVRVVVMWTGALGRGRSMALDTRRAGYALPGTLPR